MAAGMEKFLYALASGQPGDRKEECCRELQEVLEEWLILKLRDNDPDIPPAATKLTSRLTT